MLVILSDVWLNQPRVRLLFCSLLITFVRQVMEKLRDLFHGYASNDIIPIAFVLMGDFSSEPFAYSGSSAAQYQGTHFVYNSHENSNV